MMWSSLQNVCCDLVKSCSRVPRTTSWILIQQHWNIRLSIPQERMQDSRKFQMYSHGSNIWLGAAWHNWHDWCEGPWWESFDGSSWLRKNLLLYKTGNALIIIKIDAWVRHLFTTSELLIYFGMNSRKRSNAHLHLQNTEKKITCLCYGTLLSIAWNDDFIQPFHFSTLWKELIDEWEPFVNFIGNIFNLHGAHLTWSPC